MVSMGRFQDPGGLYGWDFSAMPLGRIIILLAGAVCTANDASSTELSVTGDGISTQSNTDGEVSEYRSIESLMGIAGGNLAWIISARSLAEMKNHLLSREFMALIYPRSWKLFRQGRICEKTESP
jgi:hypothetical protein